jgi:hypothetical protein
MREKFINWKPHRATLAVIAKANEIIAEYEEQGFRLTLRQLFYQFVSRTWLVNDRDSYDRLGRIVAKARNAGLIDWNAIEDRTRKIVNYSFWDNPGELVSAYAHHYREDLWAAQPYRPFVIIEKDALLGVIEDVCKELRVPYGAARGDASITFEYELAKRFSRFIDQGYIPLVLHLADHDPKGLDMTRVIRTSLKLYAREPIEVRRIALTLEQVEQYEPPPNEIKDGDTLSPGYLEEFGEECWELDALSPTVIADLIREEVEDLIETEAWEEAQAAEERNRKVLQKAGERWEKVEQLLARPRITPR